MEDAWTVLRDARDLERCVVFAYKKPGPNPARLVIFSPFQLDDESTIGFDHQRDEVRRFRYDRMKGVELEIDAEYVRPTN